MIAIESCGLNQLTQEKLLSVFRKNSAIKRVVLYGSRAKGNFKEGSDIDLTIESDQLSMKDLLQLQNEIDDLLLPYKVDLSLLRFIDNPQLRDHIQRVGLDFYEKS